MEPKDAQKIILEMREKYNFVGTEDEAIMMAIGVLDSAAFTKTRIKKIFNNRKKRFNP